MVMDYALDSEVRRTVDSLSQQFLSAMQDASHASKFADSWTAFSNQIQSFHEKLASETLSRIYSLASTIETISSGLLECHASTSELGDGFAADISNILEEDLAALSMEKGAESRVNSPAYIELASKWLSDNVHNPYPDLTVKDSIAQQCHASRKDVDAWFVDARKRIGWNSLRKSHFNNKRADIVDAAKRFLVRQEAFLPHNVESQFVAIEHRAKSLHQKFGETSLASQLDSAVRDMTPDLKARIQAKNGSRRVPPSKRPYPTPELSPQSSPSASLPSPTPSICTLPESRSLKRRASSFDSEAETEFDSPLSTKRPRLHDTQLATESPQLTGLLSPAPSDAGDLGDIPTPVLDPAPSSTVKRKRRLSETNGEPPSKRANTRQTVSNPLPESLPFANDFHFDSTWLQGFCDLLPEHADIPPLNVTPPDPTVPLDIQWLDPSSSQFDFIQSGQPSLPSTSTPSTSLEPNVTEIQRPGPPASQHDPLAWLSVDQVDFGYSPDMFDFPSIDLNSCHSPAMENPLPSAITLSPWASFSQDLPTLLNFGSLIPTTSIPSYNTPPQLSEMEKELKRKQLEDFEAQCNALRAELAAAS